MTVNEIISAAALKLGELFPDRLVYVNEIHQEADGNHFIRCIDQSHTKRLGRRRERSYTFEILYFCNKTDNLAFHGWAETMYFAFESLTINGQELHLTGAHAKPGDDMVFHFVFDVTFTGLIDPPDGDPMGDLTIDGGVKE